MSALFDLTGDVAVVVGGTGVLGGALAEGLAAAGASVAVLGRNTERGLARAATIEASGGKAVFVAADASDRDSLAAALEVVTSSLGAPSILVNAAGGNDPKVTVTDTHSIESISASDWAAAFDLNLIGGALLPSQVFGPGMCERGRGSIINIASVSAHLPLSRVVAYSSAKAAVLNFTQFLSREWAKRGVRVNSITPGFFPANRTARFCFNPTVRRRPVHRLFGGIRRWLASGNPLSWSVPAFSSQATPPRALSQARTCAWTADF